MDKSWIHIRNRLDSTYIEGVEKFIEFAYEKKQPNSKIYCPCKKCSNLRFETRKGVKEHLVINGFDTKYTRWTIHGELVASSSEVDANQDFDFLDDMVGMVHDAFGVPRTEFEGLESTGLGADDETKNFFKLLEDAQRELYPNCTTFTKLSFIVHLLHIKVLSGWTDTSFDMLLELLKKAFPIGETLPKSFSEAKKFNEALGFSYKKYDACPKDCMLFWKDKKELHNCEKCGRSRYREAQVISDDGTTKVTQIPVKQVRHFPLKPTLQKLFMSKETSKHMRWHVEGRTDDGKWRHPADTLAWKTFDEEHPDFAKESRNVRLGLAADGFNPFRTMSIAHSTWPVVLMPYNLPPWLCMKQPFFILALLIDGPHGPGNDIDVYLQPLIEELKELWIEGVLTYDASNNQMFCMHAALMWTISDFPGYAILSGWSTKGALACPNCNVQTHSQWLQNFRKYIYMGHRRYLDLGHMFRKDAICFDGTVETRQRPLHLSGADIFKQIEFIQNNFGKGEEKGRSVPKKRRPNANEGGSGDTAEQGLKDNWKKKSIFFDLPYWKENMIRHNLDLMHTEKNFLENILWTILDIVGKTKDNLKARLDLMVMGIRKALHPQQRPGGKVFLPPASFTMSKEQKDIFCKVLKDVKVPDGYSLNISRRVNLKERSISGLKSHDCHILMQQLLPLAARRAARRALVPALGELIRVALEIESSKHVALMMTSMATTQKHARLRVGRMTDVLEPRVTNSEPHARPPPSCINNQPHLQPEPQVQAKRARCPVAPMSAILQHLATASEEQEGHQSPPSNHGFHSPSDDMPGQISERVTEPRSHQGSNCNNTTSNLHLPEQTNEGSTTLASDLGQRKAKGRGPARPNAKWGTGEKLVIDLNEVDIPIGNTAGPLQSQLGILARNGNLAPLTFTDWRARELRPYKERIWAEVKANVDTPDVFKHNCLRSVGKKWRDWKDELKKDFYDIYDNDEDRLANCPDRVDADQWIILVKFWGSKTAKTRSTTNRASRKKQTMGHTSGRKSHCRVRAELKAKKGGVDPDRIEVFTETHTKRNGNAVDEASSLAICRLEEGASQIPPDSSERAALREELFTEVLKLDRNGWLRTYGLGPCRSQVFGTRYTRSQDQRIKDQLRAEVRQEVLAEVGGEIDILKREYARMAAHMAGIGHPLPPSPNGNGDGDRDAGGDHGQSLSEHN